jgi:hypothetical protein
MAWADIGQRSQTASIDQNLVDMLETIVYGIAGPVSGATFESQNADITVIVPDIPNDKEDFCEAIANAVHFMPLIYIKEDLRRRASFKKVVLRADSPAKMNQALESLGKTLEEGHDSISELT